MLLTRSQNAGERFPRRRRDEWRQRAAGRRRAGRRPTLHSQAARGSRDERSANQEDPGEQADADRQDQRIDQCGPIGVRASPSDEQMNRPAMSTGIRGDRARRRSRESRRRLPVAWDSCTLRSPLKKRNCPAATATTRPWRGLVHLDAGRRWRGTPVRPRKSITGRCPRAPAQTIESRKQTGDGQVPDPHPLP